MTDTVRISTSVVAFEETDSTNERALADVRAGDAADGAVYVAERQTAGRGSQGKAWASTDGLGLAFSVVLLDDAGEGPLPFLAAVAICDALRAAGVDAHVKWPNDVLVGEHKIAGVLIEAIHEGRRRAWVVGCGVNVNQLTFPEEIAGVAVSARQATGREHDREALLIDVLRRMDGLLAGGTDLVGAFKERCRMLGRRIVATRDGRRLVVRVRDVDAAGHLVVEDPSGAVETWVSASGLDISPRFR